MKSILNTFKCSRLKVKFGLELLSKLHAGWKGKTLLVLWAHSNRPGEVNLADHKRCHRVSTGNLAATYVREAAAQLMLKNFYESLFLPYREYYQQSGVNFSPVSKFFLGHIEGVEDEHAAHAMRDALCACRSENDLASFKDGAAKLLEAQANLWDALHRRMIEY